MAKAPPMSISAKGVLIRLSSVMRLLTFNLSIVALLDLASEQLECSGLVLALEKASPLLGELLHSLMYVGGAVVTAPPFPVNPAYILVGLEL